MKTDVQLELLKLNKNHRIRLIWYRIVSILACITVFVTTYALILPAVTMESASDEDIRADLHSGGKVLRCPFEVHKHTDKCYDKDKNLICGYADYAVHKHDKSCYGEDGELVCKLPQIEAHTHDLNCEDKERNLVCGKNEVILHKHSKECYDENGSLICTKPEVVEHVHTDACFKMPAVSFSNEYDGLGVELKADEGVFPVVSSPLQMKTAAPDEKIRNIIENKLSGKFDYTIVDICVMSGENKVGPSENVTLTFRNIGSRIRMSDAIVCHIDDSGKETQLELTENKDGTAQVSTRAMGTFVVASPELTRAAKGSASAKSPARSGANYADRLTDRSNDIGVFSEGYDDSPYTFTKTYNMDFNIWTSDVSSAVGGTIFIGKTNLTNRDVKVWQTEQYWDGKVPFRISSEKYSNGTYANGTLDFQNYNDFLLEDGSRLSGVTAPNAPLKLDHLNLEYCKVNALSRVQNLYGRGNKFVIGENVTTESGKTWKLYGGTEHSSSAITGQGRPDVITNIVVASGDWGYVFGGGEGPTGRGTQVTIRGDANVENVYGGGERKGSVGINDTPGTGQGINVYIEGGNVGNVFGGSAINGNKFLSGDGIPLCINEDINIDVPDNNSACHIDRIVGGSDTTDSSTMSYSVLADSPINGDVTVNIAKADSVDCVAGDPNRNTPRSATDVRQVQGYTLLNVTASNDFDYFDLFDTVNITGSDVVVSTGSKAGYSLTDSSLTWWGDTSGSRDGYIGQIRVAEGAKLILDHGGVINRPYSHYISGTWQNGTEGNKVLKASANHDPYYLSKSWVGENDESRRSLSTVAIDGQGANITAASGTAFDDSNDVCGLRIYGTVQGELGTHTSTNRSFNNDVPGYSTLEVRGTPLYSDDQDYYYYIVADSSANGGKAFKEPEGADYIVCYRTLSGGKIGWYLRERPVITMSNKLVRAGDTANGQMSVHVDLNGLAYEWSSNSAENRVDISWTKVTGTDAGSLTTSSGSASLSAIAAIQPPSGSSYPDEFDYVIDSSTPIDPTYYEVEVDYHVQTSEGGTTYDDIRTADTTTSVRCIYDFAGNDAHHSAEGYSDSVMDTSPYSTKPAGQDTALLRLYLPYGVTGDLDVSENDGHFRFTDNTSVDAQLIQSSTVVTNCDTANETTANSRFAVTIGGSELSQNITKNLTQSVTKYVCTVYSHKKISISDISQNSSAGLQLNLALSDLQKGGEAVGANDPSAVNNGELQIRTVPFRVSLVITKQVANASSNKSFPFTLSLKDENNQPVILSSSSVTGTATGVTIDSTTGAITFSLQDTQSIRLSDIPTGSTFTVSETEHNGFSVVIKENNTPIVTGDSLTNYPLDSSRTITFVNSGGYVLPATGSSGIYFYIIFGMIIMAAPIIIGFVLKHKEKRRVEKM